MAEEFFDEEEENESNDIDVKNDIFNYKGYFVENATEEDEEQKFFEFGAHFPYKYLYQRLEIIAQERKMQRLEIEKKLMEKEKNKSSDEKIQLSIKSNEVFSSMPKKKSRNRDCETGARFTYAPQINKNNLNEKSFNRIKSSLAKNQTQSKNLLSSNKKKPSKKITQSQMKIRKRNDNRNLNNYNSKVNTVSINLINAVKFNDNKNSKFLTHEIPFNNKNKNNSGNKIKTNQFSKEKEKRQIVNNTNENTKKKINKENIMNKIILNKLHNNNNKWSCPKFIGYQNITNNSSSKIFVSKEKNLKINNKQIKTNPNFKQNGAVAHVKSKKNCIVKKKTNNKMTIPNKTNVKTNIQNEKDSNFSEISTSPKHKNFGLIDKIGNSKNTMSRNNQNNLFTNQTVSNLYNKNFRSLNNIANVITSNCAKNNFITHNNMGKNKISNDSKKVLIQNSKKNKQNSNAKSGKSLINKNGKTTNNISNGNVSKNSLYSGSKRNTSKINNFNISINDNFKMNLNNIQEKLKEYLKKNTDKVTIKTKNGIINQNSYLSKKKGEKNVMKIKNGNSEKRDKLFGKNNNNVSKGHTDKKNNININININNQNNIILNNKIFKK